MCLLYCCIRLWFGLKAAKPFNELFLTLQLEILEVYWNKKRRASQERTFSVSCTRYFIVVTKFLYDVEQCECTAVSIYILWPWQTGLNGIHTSCHAFFEKRYGSLWLCTHSFTNYVSCSGHMLYPAEMSNRPIHHHATLISPDLPLSLPDPNCQLCLSARYATLTVTAVFIAPEMFNSKKISLHMSVCRDVLHHAVPIRIGETILTPWNHEIK